VKSAKSASPCLTTSSESPPHCSRCKPAENGYRLVFEIEATRATEMSISQYIFRRQVEIIKELKDYPGLSR